MTRLRIMVWLLTAMVFGLISCSSDKGTEPAQQKIPTVSTVIASAVAQTSAQSGGTITSDGGAEVTARGVSWSTSATPTTADNMTADGGGSGSFTSLLTGLIPSTQYYVRAYATNGVGTGYGSAESFTTIAPLRVISSFDTDEEGWTVSGGAIYYKSTDGTTSPWTT